MESSFINKNVFIYFFCCFYSLSCLGQETGEDHSKNNIAVVINGNVGSVIPYPFSNIPNDANASMQVRPYFGIQMNRSLSPRFYLKFSAMYSNKSVAFDATLKNQSYNGYIEHEVNGIITGDYVEDAYFNGISNGYYKLQYIETNLSLSTKITDKSAIYFGIYFAYLIKGENEITVDGTISLAPDIPPISGRFESTENYSDNLNKSDFGLQIGFERKIYKRLNADVQFSSGLHSIYNDDLEAIDYNMLNMYVAFGFTYYLRNNVLN